jgi:hypothetical protein
MPEALVHPEREAGPRWALRTPLTRLLERCVVAIAAVAVPLVSWLLLHK